MNNLFDLRARRLNLLRHLDCGGNNFLRDHAVALMQERIADVSRDFGDILLHAHPSIDLSLVNSRLIKRCHLLLDGEDGDLLSLPVGGYDLFYSLLELHWLNNLRDDLLRIYFCLRDGGLFQGCFIGGGSLSALRDCLLRSEAEIYGGASNRVIPFYDMSFIVGLMSEIGFSFPVVDREVLNVRYSSIYSLMRDLRFMGESNFLSERRSVFTGRRLFERAGEIYADEYSDEDGLIVRFELIFVHAWR